jgi:cytoskeletal protein CcmA (bactofilin family)
LKSPVLQDRKGNTLSAMWKPTQQGSISPNPNANTGPNPEPIRSVPNPPAPEPARSAPIAAGEQATIGKGLFVKGEISGLESLFIDGKVEGSINLPGNRVTVGRNGQVSANITAREIVVLGKVRGNVSASDRVDIRAEGSLSGDVAASRISIEDGAFFKGGIDIRKPDAKPTAAGAPISAAAPAPAEVTKTA